MLRMLQLLQKCGKSMAISHYKLEPYRGKMSRNICPSCRRKSVFTLYLDTKTGLPISPNVGRCNREINCGYHFPPNQYFKQNPNLVNETFQSHLFKATDEVLRSSQQTSVIPDSMFEMSFSNVSKNNFVKYLLSLFGTDLTKKLIETYLIGSSKYWLGANVFWQVDILGQIRTGKIVLYDSTTGKRIREPVSHIAWVHSALKIKNFNLKQCFFGEHLLNISLGKSVAIVESEKTAIIASVYMPQFIWLASGSLSNLGIEKFRILKGRKIVLFPDLNGFQKWKQKALEIERFLNSKILVSDFLELHASDYEKELGLDIADYLIVRDEIFGWALSENHYPIFWDH